MTQLVWSSHELSHAHENLKINFLTCLTLEAPFAYRIEFRRRVSETPWGHWSSSPEGRVIHTSPKRWCVEFLISLASLMLCGLTDDVFCADRSMRMHELPPDHIRGPICKIFKYMGKALIGYGVAFKDLAYSTSASQKKFNHKSATWC